MKRARFPRHARGLSLVETMVSMAVLAIGVLGVAQMQVMASAQNGIARRTSRAAAIARDFVETAMRWEYTDPRLNPAAVCNAVIAIPSDQNPPPAGETYLGTAKAPGLTMQFTATPSSNPNATNEGTVADGLTAGATVYTGAAQTGPNQGLLGDSMRDGYQLMWSVRLIDTDPNVQGYDNGACEAKQVYVVVRYPIGNGRTYRNLITSFLKYDNHRMGAGAAGSGLPELL